MEAAGLDSDAALRADVPGSHTGMRSESVTFGGSNGNTHGVRNEVALKSVASNRNGGGAIAFPPPGTLTELPTPELHGIEHGFLARAGNLTFDLVEAFLLMVIFAPL